LGTLREDLNIYAELSGIDTDTLHNELLAEKELGITELKARNLIDDVAV